MVQTAVAEARRKRVAVDPTFVLTVEEAVLCARTFRGMANEAEKAALESLAAGDRGGWEGFKEVAATYRWFAVTQDPSLTQALLADCMRHAHA